MERTSVGNIGNTYGGLSVMDNNGKYYWIIDGYDVDSDNINEYEQISKTLYDALIDHEQNKIQ